MEVRAGDSLLTAYFLDAWRDCLPEAWRQEAELEVIHVRPPANSIKVKRLTI